MVSPPVVRNNFMAFNVGQGVLAYLPALGDYSDLYFNNSNHGENSDPGPGTIFADPMFTESYELRDGSPCINAGDTVKRYADPDGTASDMRALYHTCCFGPTRGNVDKYGEIDLTDLCLRSCCISLFEV